MRKASVAGTLRLPFMAGNVAITSVHSNSNSHRYLTKLNNREFLATEDFPGDPRVHDAQHIFHYEFSGYIRI